MKRHLATFATTFAIGFVLVLIAGCATQPKTDWAGVSTGVGAVLTTGEAAR